MAMIEVIGGSFPKQQAAYLAEKIIIKARDKSKHIYLARAAIDSLEKVSEDKKSITFNVTLKNGENFIGIGTRKLYDMLYAEHVTGPQDGDVSDNQGKKKKDKTKETVQEVEEPEPSAISDAAKAFVMYAISIFFIIIAITSMFGTELFLGLALLICSLVIMPYTGKRFGRFSVKQRTIALILLVIFSAYVDDKFNEAKVNEIRAENARINEQNRQNHLAELEPKREALVSEIKSSMDNKDYEAAIQASKPYINIGDPEIDDLFEEARNAKNEIDQEEMRKKKAEQFKRDRAEIIEKIESFIAIGNYGAATNEANKYLDQDDKKINELHSKASDKHKEQLANQKVKQAAANMNVDYEKTAVIVNCQTLVKSSLKAPRTAKFPFVTDVNVSPDKMYFTINSYVDAQNSYGAMLRNNYHCKMKFNGGGQYGWKLESFDVQ